MNQCDQVGPRIFLDIYCILSVLRIEQLGSRTLDSCQTRNCHFLTYITSCWKNKPSLLIVGVLAHPLLLYLLSRTKLQGTLQLRGQIPPPIFLLYPYMFSVAWIAPLPPFHRELVMEKIFMVIGFHIRKNNEYIASINFPELAVHSSIQVNTK